MLNKTKKQSKSILFGKPPLYPECRPCFSCDKNRTDIEYLLKKVQYLESKILDLEKKDKEDISIRSLRSLPRMDSSEDTIADFNRLMKNIKSGDSFDNMEDME